MTSEPSGFMRQGHNNDLLRVLSPDGFVVGGFELHE